MTSRVKVCHSMVQNTFDHSAIRFVIYLLVIHWLTVKCCTCSAMGVTFVAGEKRELMVTTHFREVRP